METEESNGKPLSRFVSPRGLLQVEFLDLHSVGFSGAGMRERLAGPNNLGSKVLRHLLFAKPVKEFYFKRPRVVGDYCSHNFRLDFVLLYAEYNSVGNEVRCKKTIFNFFGADTYTMGLDHLIFSSDKIEKSFVIRFYVVTRINGDFAISAARLHERVG